MPDKIMYNTKDGKVSNMAYKDSEHDKGRNRKIRRKIGNIFVR